MSLTPEQINLVYEIVLGRSVDDTGLAAFLRMSTGNDLTLHSVAQAIFPSLEFQTRFGNPDIFNRLRDISYRDVTLTLPEDDFTYQELRNGGVYEPYVSNHLFNQLKPGDVFCDVGANLGLYSLPASKFVGPRGKVLAFEASSRNANLLMRSGRANLLNNINVFPLALSDSNGSVLSPVFLHTSNKILLSEDNQTWRDVEVIPVVKLDNFLEDQKIDVMKIDVDGFEYRVLRGAINTIRNCLPKIYMEYCPQLLPAGSGVSGAALLELVMNLGYRPTILHRNRAAEFVNGPAERVVNEVETALEEHVRSGGTHLDLFWNITSPRPSHDTVTD